MNTKKLTLLGILSALYVVCSLTLKIPMGIGAIALDLGYLALTVAIFTVGPWAAIVGGLGAFIESLVFSPYGISWGWVIMNVLIGLICGFAINKIELNNLKNYLISALVIICAVLVGISAKTIFECAMYNIPVLVKIPKSVTAFGIDTIVMIAGLPIASKIKSIVMK